MWNFNYKQSLRVHKENDGDTGEYVPQTYTRIFHNSPQIYCVNYDGTDFVFVPWFIK